MFIKLLHEKLFSTCRSRLKAFACSLISNHVLLFGLLIFVNYVIRILQFLPLCSLIYSLNPLLYGPYDLLLLLLFSLNFLLLL